MTTGYWGLCGHRGLQDLLAQAAHKVVLARCQVLLGEALHLRWAPSSIEDLANGLNSLNPHYAQDLSVKEVHGVITPMALRKVMRAKIWLSRTKEIKVEY